MADWGFNPNSGGEIVYYPTSGYRVSCTSGASNSKGSYVELCSALPFDCILNLINISGGEYEHLLDFAIGAAGSELIIVENIAWSCASLNIQNFSYPVPIPLAAGTRLSIRGQVNDGSTRLTEWALELISINNFAGTPAGTKFITLGADTSDSGGTQVDPGGTNHTYGSYVELASSLEYPLIGFYLHIGTQGNKRSNTYWYLDVAIGSAGNEQPILSRFPVHFRETDDKIVQPITGVLPLPIAAGERVSIRAMCDSTATPQRYLDVVFYGLL